MEREVVSARYPIHITMRLKPGLKTLRSPEMKRAFKHALGCAKGKGLAISEYAIESNHLHMFGEAPDNAAIGAGMASFGASFGKAVRKYNRGRGSVFAGRYHLRVFKSPTEVRYGLAYVLLNHSKHEGSTPYPDDYSSGIFLDSWGDLLGGCYRNRPAAPRPPCLSDAKSWLARVGWRKSKVRVGGVPKAGVRKAGAQRRVGLKWMSADLGPAVPNQDVGARNRALPNQEAGDCNRAVPNQDLGALVPEKPMDGKARASMS